jgi:REP element-mobilizing transposase RayT
MTPMANTYSQLFYHIVFSTKERRNFINQEIEERVWITSAASRENMT